MAEAAPGVDPELSRQYSVEPWLVHDAAATMADYRARSDAALPAYQGVDIPYGAEPRQLLDICAPAGAPDPVPALLFIHGGYWRGSSKDERRFAAPAMTDAGIAWVPVEYRLMPDVRLDDIIHDIRSAIAWVHAHAADYGLDPTRLFVSGNSAGGHLTGMAVAAGWQADYGVPEDVIKGACAVSGLFDLDPLRHTSDNEFLGFTAEEAARCSPVRHLPARDMPLVVSWGAHESEAFKQQSRDYAAAAVERGLRVSVFETEGADHFTVIGDFADPVSRLFQETAGMIAGATA